MRINYENNSHIRLHQKKMPLHSAPPLEGRAMTNSHPALGITPAQIAVFLAARHRSEAAKLLMVLVEKQHPEAMLLLAQMYLDGDGVALNRDEAFRLFSLAAKHDNPMGHNMQGRCYENGWGVDLDLEKAANAYEQAAQRGLDWGQYNLANLLAKGLGVAENQKAAFALYLAAAKHGNARAMNAVGRYYQEGIAVAQDDTLAFEWFARAAQAGDSTGQVGLASVLADMGRIDESLFWIEEAINTANPKALSALLPALKEFTSPEFEKVAQLIEQRLTQAA